MKRNRFVCSECGAEYWLQAWKAVCPSCKAEFTLEARPEKHSQPRMYGNLLTTLAMFGYVLFSILAPSGQNLYGAIPLVPTPVLLGLTLVLALFAYAGNEPALWLSAVYGASVAIFHVFNMSWSSLLGMIIGSVVVVSSLSYLRKLLRLRKHDSREPDARSMPEYSGWAGPQESV